MNIEQHADEAIESAVLFAFLLFTILLVRDVLRTGWRLVRGKSQAGHRPRHGGR